MMALTSFFICVIHRLRQRLYRICTIRTYVYIHVFIYLKHTVRLLSLFIFVYCLSVFTYEYLKYIVSLLSLCISLLSFSLFQNKKVSLAKGEPHEVKDHSVKVSYCFVSSRTKLLLHVYSFFFKQE